MLLAKGENIHRARETAKAQLKDQFRKGKITQTARRLDGPCTLAWKESRASRTRRGQSTPARTWPSRWWSGWKSWCHSCRGGGQVGSQSVWNHCIVNSKCRFTHRIGRQLPPKISTTGEETIWYVIMYITNLVDRQEDWSNKLTLCETPSGLPTCLVVLQRRCFKDILYNQILKIML